MGKSVIVVLPLALLLIASGQAVAQTPPTATEAFNLRIRCKQMADQKTNDLEQIPVEFTYNLRA